ncbi:MAG: ABC transporter permease [Propioniciclava sp.]
MTSSTSAAAAEFARRQHTPLERVRHLLHGHPWLSPLLILVVTTLVFAALNPRYLAPSAQSLLFQQVAVIACLAIGQTLVILTAGIDLSVGASAILSMMVMASLAADQGVHPLVALLIGILLAVAAGFLNGFLVTAVNLPPFIVTLGTLSIFTAVALLYSGGRSIQNTSLPDLLNWTGTTIALGPFHVTVGVLMVLALYAVVGFVLSQTAWGRHVYAVGDDPDSARLSGVASKRVLLSVYMVAGLIYGVAAWIQIGRAGAASPNGIVDANLDSITAVVIGGTSLFGGRGGVIGTLLGAVIVGAFTLGLSLAGVDQQWRLLAIGVLVIVAVSLDQWIRRVKA